MEAENAAEWEHAQKRLADQSSAAPALSYLLYGKDEFGQQYEITQRRFALLGLCAVGKAAQSATPRILDLFRSEEDHELWEPAAIALVGIGSNDNRFAPYLTHILVDAMKYPTIRVSAVRALAYAVPATPETLHALREAQNDELGIVRTAAAGALWRLRRDPKEVLPTLISSLNHKLKTVRIAALRVVLDMGSSAETCQTAVERLVNDEDEKIRHVALAARESLRAKSNGVGNGMREDATNVHYVVKAGGGFVPITKAPSSNPVTIEFARWDRHLIRSRTLAVFRLTNAENSSILLWNLRAQVKAAGPPEQSGWETVHDDYPGATASVFAPGGTGEFWVERPETKPWRACILYSKQIAGSHQNDRRFGGNFEVISHEISE